MSNVKKSLTRKIGPLPAWAWAIIAGVAIYVYRSRRALTTGAGTPASADVNSPSVSDQTGGGQSPVTLQPGESVYDPNTGQLVGGAPEQLAPTDSQPPITLEPGESAYNPDTGQVVGPDAQPLTGAAGTNRTGKHKTKRRTKAKHGHAQRKGVHVPTHGKRRARSVAKLVSGARKMKSHRRVGSTRAGSPHSTAPKGRTRGKVSTHPRVIRARATREVAPSLRQRPAAPKATNPATQRVEPHPAREPARRPAPRPGPRRRRK